MSSFEHSRFRIFNPSQHPYRHDMSEFAYANGRMPGITNVKDTLDYVVAVLYPDYKGTVATSANLPASGNSANDYMIVSDDGTGHAAGYVWSVLDNTGQWIKRYDMAWSMDSILSETINRTQYMYMQKYGVDDKDANGNIIAGLFAGQSIYGGASASGNLTLNANAGDAPGAHTGYVQVNDHFRPTADNTFSSGTSLYRWASVYTLSLTAGTLSASSGSITDSSGAISFGANNLTTTGSLNGATAAITTSLTVSNLSLSAGSLTCSTGSLSFGSNNISTTGTLTGAAGSVLANLTFSTSTITSASGNLSLGSANLATTGTLSAGAGTLTSLQAANLQISGNTLSATNLNGNLTISPNGTGSTLITSALSITGNYSSTSGNLTLTNGQANISGLQLSGATLSATTLNANLTLSPNGTGLIALSSGIYPTTSGSFDSGKSGSLWNYLWLSGGIKDGTNTILSSDLMRLRNAFYRDTGRTQPAQTGDALFFDAVSGTWLASVPDNEITHSTISGLTSGDAGHTQFLMLAGRAGGQAVQGGTAASENLTLESTSNATKGSVLIKDSLKPNTNASYTTSWSGTDLGDNTHYFRDVYTKGQHYGLRLENTTSASLPASSASNTGRLVFATDNNKIYVDTGTNLIVAGLSKYISDTSWNGVQTSQTFTISGIVDARNAMWSLSDNTNNYERVFAKITPISASQVTVTTNVALPSGSYRLIGME